LSSFGRSDAKKLLSDINIVFEMIFHG